MVVVKNILMYYEGGILVGTVDAHYDISNLPERLHGVLGLLQPVKFSSRTPEEIAKTKLAYRERDRKQKEWKALPWYKKIYTPYPKWIDFDS